MLKTTQNNQIRMITQPDHAHVSAYLAAHWGGVNGFVKPGYFAPFADPERLRQEVVAAIAEHDSGWLEWEAFPTIDPRDHRPQNLLDVSRDHPEDGLNRWRLGVPRFADEHPYVALLISLHAYWLYAPGVRQGAVPPQPFDEAMRHPLFNGRDKAADLISDRDLMIEFLAEQELVQQQLFKRLHDDADWAAATQPGHVLPHLKLLQLLDAMSLLMCFAMQDEREWPDIPRASWEDRVTLRWQPLDDRRIAVSPYPFDLKSLRVRMPAHVADLDGGAPSNPDADHANEPLVDLHRLPLEMIEYDLVPAE